MTLEISSGRFTYNARNLTFASEASTLQVPPGVSLQSFYIRSERTGNTRLFLYSHADMCPGGEDVLAFRFVSPGNGFTAIVFND